MTDTPCRFTDPGKKMKSLEYVTVTVLVAMGTPETVIVEGAALAVAVPGKPALTR